MILWGSVGDTVIVMDDCLSKIFSRNMGACCLGSSIKRERERKGGGEDLEVR